MLRPESADPAAYGETCGDEQCQFHVHVPSLVIGPESEDPDGQQECREGCPLCLDLRHAVEVDQCRDQKGSSTDPDQTRHHADHRPQ